MFSRLRLLSGVRGVLMSQELNDAAEIDPPLIEGEGAQKADPPPEMDPVRSGLPVPNRRASAMTAGKRTGLAALDLVREASAAIQASEQRVADLEEEMRSIVVHFRREIERANTETAAAEKRAASAEAEALDAEARMRDAEDMVCELHDAILDGFSPWVQLASRGADHPGTEVEDQARIAGPELIESGADEPDAPASGTPSASSRASRTRAWKGPRAVD